MPMPRIPGKEPDMDIHADGSTNGEASGAAILIDGRKLSPRRYVITVRHGDTNALVHSDMINPHSAKDRARFAADVAARVGVTEAAINVLILTAIDQMEATEADDRAFAGPADTAEYIAAHSPEDA